MTSATTPVPSRMVIRGERIGRVEIVDDGREQARAITEFTSNSSIHGLPTCSAKVDIRMRPELVAIERGDRITFAVTVDGWPERTLFSGEITELKLTGNAGIITDLSFRAVSPFMRLARTTISERELPVDALSSIRVLADALVARCGIEHRIQIDAGVQDSIKMIIVEGVTCLSLLKHLMVLRRIFFRCEVGDDFRLYCKEDISTKRVVSLSPENVLKLEFNK